MPWTAAGSSRVLPKVALLLALVALSDPARPDNATGQPPPDYATLTFHGITLYGIIDASLQYDTHAAPASSDFISGVAELVQKNSNGALFTLVPNGLGASRVGLRGDEPLAGDLAGVFELTTVFDPLSGELLNCLKSETVNSGKALTAQTTGGDCPYAGQVFARAAYVGFHSESLGQLTYGRQRSLLADVVGEYDPAPSFAFSLLSAGIAGSGGDVEDFILDSVVKYSGGYGPVHLGALYQFDDTAGAGGTAWQMRLGADASGSSIDAVYSHKKDAIATVSLSAAQVAQLAPLGYSVSNAVAATVSDNTAWAIMAAHDFGPPKLFAGYEHIVYADPAHPLESGYDTIGGYVLAFVNDVAYDRERVLQFFWGGLSFPVTPRLVLAAAGYGFRQNSYATGMNVGCSGTQSPACSGWLSAWSLSADFRMSKRIDLYGGVLRSRVADGFASGYLNTGNLSATLGLRFRF